MSGLPALATRHMQILPSLHPLQRRRETRMEGDWINSLTVNVLALGLKAV
jgi:hypothetical protein